MKTIKKAGYKITFIKDRSCFVVKFSNATRNKVFRTKDKVEASQAYNNYKNLLK